MLVSVDGLGGGGRDGWLSDWLGAARRGSSWLLPSPVGVCIFHPLRPCSLYTTGVDGLVCLSTCSHESL